MNKKLLPPTPPLDVSKEYLDAAMDAVCLLARRLWDLQNAVRQIQFNPAADAVPENIQAASAAGLN